MQVHGPSEITDEVSVRPNLAGGFVALQIGSVSVYIYTPAEADQLAAFVAEAKRLLLGLAHEDTPEGDAS
jgi:hypothetical protein